MSLFAEAPQVASNLTDPGWPVECFAVISIGLETFSHGSKEARIFRAKKGRSQRDVLTPREWAIKQSEILGDRIEVHDGARTMKSTFDAETQFR